MFWVWAFLMYVHEGDITFLSKFWLFFCFNYITFNQGGVGPHFFEGAGFLWFGVLPLFASLQWGWGVQHVMTQSWLLKANKKVNTVQKLFIILKQISDLFWRMISNMVRILVLPCFLWPWPLTFWQPFARQAVCWPLVSFSEK